MTKVNEAPSKIGNLEPWKRFQNDAGQRLSQQTAVQSVTRGVYRSEGPKSVLFENEPKAVWSTVPTPAAKNIELTIFD